MSTNNRTCQTELYVMIRVVMIRLDMAYQIPLQTKNFLNSLLEKAFDLERAMLHTFEAVYHRFFSSSHGPQLARSGVSAR